MREIHTNSKQRNADIAVQMTLDLEVPQNKFEASLDHQNGIKGGR